MEHKKSPDRIIEELGGCGKFQIRLNVIVHFIKTAFCWSVLTMIVTVKTPEWWCADGIPQDNMTSPLPNSSLRLKSCTNLNKTTCGNFVYDGTTRTLVDEFDLVCDRAFIPSTIMSIQTAGMFVGNPLSGQIADLFGRRVPLFIAVSTVIASNLLGFFSTNWIVFAVARFFVGFAHACFMTIHYTLLSEFSLSHWRSWIVGFPSWPIEACVFALVAWQINDWQYLHLAVAICATVCLASCCMVPESFRWYMSHDKTKRAEKVIGEIARVNKVPVPELKDHFSENQPHHRDRKYTFISMFKTRYLIKVTLLSGLNWMALGLISFALNFGIRALSGNIYFNFFLFNATGIPIKLLVAPLQNRIGRRKASMMCFCLTALGGLVAGGLQYIDTSHRGVLTNVFAILSNMGITGCWGTVQTMTVELYPTVIRSIGFGTLSVVGRAGAILGPQLVFLDTFIPGVMFFICGGLSALCTVGLCFLPETMNKELSDTVETGRRNEVETHSVILPETKESTNVVKSSTITKL